LSFEKALALTSRHIDKEISTEKGGGLELKVDLKHFFRNGGMLTHK
jgi:hypothetical protein